MELNKSNKKPDVNSFIKPLAVFLFLYVASMGLALWAENKTLELSNTYLDGVDDNGCHAGYIFHPPFLISDVFGPGDVEGFQKQSGKGRKIVNIKVHSDHLISQYVRTDNNANSILPRGSLVALKYSKELVPEKEAKTNWGFDMGSFFPALLNRSSISKEIPLEHQKFTIRTENVELLDVQVFTVNDIYTRMQSDSVTDRSVENGEMIYGVPSSSLIAMNDDTVLLAIEDFKINIKSLPAFKQNAQTLHVSADSYFKVITKKSISHGAEYAAYTCYNSKGSQLDVSSYYWFQFFDSENDFKETTFFANPYEMNFQGNVIPYLSPQVEALKQVQGKLQRIFKNQTDLDSITTSFTEINYQGFLRLPTETNASNKEESLDDQKSYTHYGTEIDPFASDDWGKASTICGIMELSNLWKRHCDQKYHGTGCQLQIGDISFPVQGFVTSSGSGRAKWKKTKKCRGSGRRRRCKQTTPGDDSSTQSTSYITPSSGKDILGHATHYEGTCVDIRPLRIDNESSPTQIRSGVYDRTKTTAFLKLARAYGASKRYFNDSKIISLGLSDRMPGHDDHVHICFEEKNFCEATSDRSLDQLLFSKTEK
jgi:hypothetical protein